jgi:hypothetical protein
MKKLFFLAVMCPLTMVVSASAEPFTARVNGRFVDICSGPVPGGNDCSARGLFEAASQVCLYNSKGNRASNFAVAAQGRPDQLARFAQHGEQGAGFIRREGKFRARQHLGIFRQHRIGATRAKKALVNGEDNQCLVASRCQQTRDQHVRIDHRPDHIEGFTLER